MENKDLRIGNIIQFTLTQDIVMVSGIYKQNMFSFVSNNKINSNGSLMLGEMNLIKDFSPIPLIEEWLIKFGLFKKEDFYYIVIENDNWIFISKESDYIWNIGVTIWNDDEECICRESSTNFTKLEYVHELQNIIYFLLRQELEIK